MAKGLRILLVEDEPELASALEATISSWNYHVLHAESIRAASEKMRNEKFGILVLDLNLKNKSGLTLIEGLRENSTALNQTTPIFIHSGFINQNVVGNHQSDISEFFVKPLNMERFKEKVSIWINKRHGVEA